MNRTKVINKLISDNGYESYLEIGLWDGKSFRDVKADLKQGVDPEWKNHSETSYNVSIGKETSDEFFERNEGKFDLIFIDGDHEASQVEKDIVNAYKVLNKGGMILLHDCNPPTYESQVVPRIQGEYCGTVWRAVLGFIKEYGTKIDTGYFDDPHGLFAIYKTGKYKVKEGFVDNKTTYDEFDRIRGEVFGV